MSTEPEQMAQTESTLSEREDSPEIRPVDDLIAYLREYARQKPCTSALICIAVGFVLGWKLKPW